MTCNHLFVFRFIISKGSKNVEAKPKPTPMDITIIPVTRDTEFGFCYARLDEIVEPRALPCGNTHCTKCIHVCK